LKRTLLDVVSLGTAVVVSGLVAAAYLYNWFWLLGSPYAVTFEGHVLWAAWMLSQGRNIYDAATLVSPPYAVMIYPPLYMVLAVPLLSVFGASYPILRCLTMVSSVVLFGLAFKLMRSSGATPIGALSGVLLFASFTPVFFFACEARVDMLALALSAGALLRFTKQFQGLHTGSVSLRSCLRQYWDVVLLCALACFTRQQSVIVPISITIYLAIRRTGWLPLYFLGSVTGLLVFAGLIIQLATGGFLQHIFYLVRGKWMLESLLWNLSAQAFEGLKCAIGSVVILLGLLGQRRIDEPAKLPFILLSVSLVAMLYSQGFIGASSNHLIFTFLALSWLIGIYLKQFPVFAAPILISTLMGLQVLAGYLPERIKELNAAPHVWSGYLPKGQMLFVEDPYLAISSGNTPAIVDGLTLMRVWEKNPAQIDSLVETINSKIFPVLIINRWDHDHGGGNVWTPAVMKAIRRSYEFKALVPSNGQLEPLYLPRR
jgi:hypothetical protein